MRLVVRGNICLGGFTALPTDLLLIGNQTKHFAAQSGIFTYVMDLLFSCCNLISVQSTVFFPFSQDTTTLSCHMFFWTGASMLAELTHWTRRGLQHSRGITTCLLLQIQSEKCIIKKTVSRSLMLLEFPWDGAPSAECFTAHRVPYPGLTLGSGGKMTLHILSADQHHLTLTITA